MFRDSDDDRDTSLGRGRCSTIRSPEVHRDYRDDSAGLNSGGQFLALRVRKHFDICAIAGKIFILSSRSVLMALTSIDQGSTLDPWLKEQLILRGRL